jgi:hypothetical protein
LNLFRLLVMPHPELAPHAEAFDELLARTPEGGAVNYDLPQPKWWFLHHLATNDFVLHGSNESAIDEFETRPNFDAHNERHVDAVFASDDAIWPLYFAVVNRSVAQSYINWCEHPGNGTSRYVFSIGSDPRDDASWTTGDRLPAAGRDVYADAREPRADEPRSRAPPRQNHCRAGRLPVQIEDAGPPTRRLGTQGLAEERVQVALSFLEPDSVSAEPDSRVSRLWPEYETREPGSQTPRIRFIYVWNLTRGQPAARKP